MSTYRVVFVCTGNICRSPLAHALLEHELEQKGLSEEVVVESAGTDAYHVGEQADSRMRKTARAHGVTIDHPARMISEAELRESDLIVAMDDGHVHKLQRLAPEAEERIVKMLAFDPASTGQHAPDVPDPWYGGIEGFENVYAMVERAVRQLADSIEREVRGD